MHFITRKLVQTVVNAVIDLCTEPVNSITMKKKVFDNIMLLERLTEEEGILLKEMQQHWYYLTKTCRALSDQAGELADDLATQSEYPNYF